MSEDSLRESLRKQLLDGLVTFTGDEAFRNVDPNVILAEDWMDSLGHFNFLQTLESAFDIEIPDHEFNFSRMGSINAMLNVIVDCAAKLKRA